MRKKIVTESDLTAFRASPVHAELLQFVDELNASVISLPRSAAPTTSKIVASLNAVLAKCSALVDNFPPSTSAGSKTALSAADSAQIMSRFGRVEFRPFYDSLHLAVRDWLKLLLMEQDAPVSGPVSAENFLDEMVEYFMNSFGNRQRIDYGTGHELHFVLFLFCFYKVGLMPKETLSGIVLSVFWSYIELMRKLQHTYWLEPAGSHGVWGLDDFHIMPFVFGSAQLVGHKHIKPKSIHNPEIVNEFSREFLYLSCIKFINSVKTEALAWHSPMLNDISAVKQWEKINSGMRKMLVGEVLNKLPIMQHLLFGKLFGNVALSLEEIEFLSSCQTSHEHSFEWTEFVGDSGAEIDVCQHHPHNLSDATNGQDEFVEVIVKHVQGPQGQQIPIYGRVLKSTADKMATPGHAPIIDTYAMGQAHPTCCGMRIPSAIASKNFTPYD